MQRAVLTLLVGLMLTLGGGASASNVLPNASPEGQYSFALGRAMENDLETAEAAFAEFPILNPGHPRVADSLFWLARIQFLQEKFTESAKTFSDFISLYPQDSRVEDARNWMEKAVLKNPKQQHSAQKRQLTNSEEFHVSEKLKKCSMFANNFIFLEPIETLIEVTIRYGKIERAEIRDKVRYQLDDRFAAFSNGAVRTTLYCGLEDILPITSQDINFSVSFSSGEHRPTFAEQGLERVVDDAAERQSFTTHEEVLFGGATFEDLRRQTEFLKQNKQTIWTIEGHTDERTTREYGLALAAKRAADIRRYFISKGLFGGRFRDISYGKERPISEGSKEPSWSKNRRVALVNVSAGSTNDDYSQQIANVGNTIYFDSIGQKKPMPGKTLVTKAKPIVRENSRTKASNESESDIDSRVLAEVEARATKLEEELLALKAQQEQRQQTITNDNQIPLIEVSSQQKDEATALVYGRATDNVGLADVQVNNELVQIGSDGSFQTQLYIPPNGLVVEITAYDLRGNKATKTLSLARKRAEGTAETRFTQLQPSLGKRGAINKNAIALIVGVEKYENLPAAPAIHADKDAEYFADFAHYKLGIPRNNIITAINSDAKRLDILKALTKVTKLSTKDKTEVFIFFAGHGLAATDGQDVFLLPYDGDKDYLDATAMTRDEIFQLVGRIEPKSVTVFLDACYTGGTRSEDITLVAGKRPVRVEALNQSVPEGFTILSASASDETSMALEAAEHGMFSYFLMKGMEGDADADNDNQITMAEMRDYVKDKVVRQSNFQQTPELQGDADRVLVRFQ